MSYDVRVTAHDRYLRIEARGTRSREASEAFFRRIAEESKARGLYDILLVLELEGRLSTFDIDDMVTKYREAGFDSRHTIAVVDKNTESRPDTRFAEDVGYVRGLKGAAFDSEEEALRWLLERRKDSESSPQDPNGPKIE
ncbi:MAG TPA: hypothetical protein VIE88_10170 [Vicinamibacteria bacterium]|jgi:hypothetical protein